MEYVQKHSELTAFKQIALLRYNLKGSCNKEGIEVRNTFINQVEEDLLCGAIVDASVYERFPLPIVLDYLKKGHSFYMNKKMPEIEQSILALVEYEQMDPILNRILLSFFSDYNQSLKEHIESEEKTIFSYIDYLFAVKDTFDNDKTKLFLQGSDSLSDFVLNHEDTEKNVAAVLEVLDLYEGKFSGFSPYHLLKRQLSVFELDLAIHAQLEDRVLVPRAIALETEVLQRCLKKC